MASPPGDRFRLLAVTMVAALAGSLAGAAMLTVDDDGPADYSSIQAAIISANNGDTILVSPGRYRETVNFLNKELTVESSEGPERTVIFLERETRIILMNGSSTLRGFTITGGRSTQAGGGVYITGPVQPLIEGNIIEDNIVEFDEFIGFPVFGGGIAVDLDAQPTITSNIIRANRAIGDAAGQYAYGGGIDLGDDTTGTVTNNLIVDNEATDTGGGISTGFAGALTPAVVTNNTIVGNRAGTGVNAFSYGGGISVYSGAEVILRNNVVADNSAAFEGGGIYFFANNLNGITYESNDFSGNLPDDCNGVSSNACSNGQLFVPPFFQNAAAGNYRPRSDSLLIDAGASTGAPTSDLLGRPRPVDGFLDGGAEPDIGAYENQRELTRVVVPDEQTINWDPSANSLVTFDVYRDLVSTIGPGPLGLCWDPALTLPTTTDLETPPAGDGFFYLVAGQDLGAGSLGFRGDGGERSTSDPCP